MLIVLLKILALMGAFSLINHFRGGGGLIGLSKFTTSLWGRPLYYSTIASILIATPLLAGSHATQFVSWAGGHIVDFLIAYTPAWVIAIALLVRPEWLIFIGPGLAFGVGYFMWGMWAWGRWQDLNRYSGDVQHKAGTFEKIVEFIVGKDNDYVAYTLRNAWAIIPAVMIVNPWAVIMVPLQTLTYHIAKIISRPKPHIAPGELMFGSVIGLALGVLAYWDELVSFIGSLF